MSMPGPNNEHWERHPTHILVFWCDNAASGRIGADRVELKQNGLSGVHHIKDFKLPEQQDELNRWIWAFERAFDAGRNAKAAEVRHALGYDR